MRYVFILIYRSVARPATKYLLIKKKNAMTVYVIVDRGDRCRTYGNLKTLCEEEGLGYSKYSKRFAKYEEYRDWKIHIWKTELVRGSRQD